MTDRLPSTSHSSPRRRNLIVWIVVGAFTVQLAAWAFWFSLAARHRVSEVPLETSAAR